MASLVILNNQKGALPINQVFKSPSDGEITLALSGSAWGSGQTLIGIDLAVDGKVLGSSLVFTNEGTSHRALIPVFIPAQLSFDEHKLTLTARAGTNTDFNDYFNVALLY